jgi:hypothetical protein
MPHQCTECGRTFADGSKQMLSGCPDCGGNKFQFQPSSAQSEARKAAAADDAPDSASDDAAEPTSGEAESADTTPAERARTDVETEMPELEQDAEATEAQTRSESASTGADQFDTGDDAEIENSTADEDRAQRDARSAPTTSDEIDEARRKMAEAEQERLAEVDDEGSDDGRVAHGRGTPQGPPTDGPDEAAAEEFGLDGAVGGPDEQPSPNAANQPGSEVDALEDGETDALEDGETDALEDGETNSFEDGETDLSALREELNDQFESIKITAPGQYELNLMELYDRKEYIISLQEDGRYVVDIPEGHEYRED